MAPAGYVSFYLASHAWICSFRIDPCPPFKVGFHLCRTREAVLALTGCLGLYDNWAGFGEVFKVHKSSTYLCHCDVSTSSAASHLCTQSDSWRG
jgi:hypothetical protein